MIIKNVPFDYRITERDWKCDAHKRNCIEANNRFTRKHHKAIKAIINFIAKIFYHLRLSRAEYSGKNFCKGKNGK